MKSLYAPWRSRYCTSPERSDLNGAQEQECDFCLQLQATTDEKNFILARFKHVTVMFNRYPYNAGHLLVIPHEHTSCLTKLSAQARCEYMEIINHSIIILQKTINPHGFNIGFNIGKAAGAGMPSHLHGHILPRYYGDTSFLPTLAQSKAVSIDLIELYQQLKPHFNAIPTL